MKNIIGQQGEVRIIKIDALPSGMQTKKVTPGPNGYIISHSEQGNHHVLTGGDVMEHTDSVPTGMKILYAILDKPATLRQDSANPHGSYALDPGFYELRISREFDPFAEQARRVAD